MSQYSTALIGGAFGLLVALITWMLAMLRERHVHERNTASDRRNKLEALYADEIALLERAIRLTLNGSDYTPLYDELSKTGARLRLLSTPAIVLQWQAAGHLLYEWSSAYRAGSPKQLGDTGFMMISSGDSEHSARAKEVYPKLNDALVQLIDEMRKHLESLR
jgi:hypothetical protein